MIATIIIAIISILWLIPIIAVMILLTPIIVIYEIINLFKGGKEYE